MPTIKSYRAGFRDCGTLPVQAKDLSQLELKGEFVEYINTFAIGYPGRADNGHDDLDYTLNVEVIAKANHFGGKRYAFSRKYGVRTFGGYILSVKAAGEFLNEYCGRAGERPTGTK